MFYNGEVKGSFEQFKNFIHSNDSFYLFGADKEGIAFYYYLIKKGKKVVSFIDNSSVKQGSTLFNIPIISPENLDLDNNKIIITSLHSDQIAQQLETLGYGVFEDYMSFDNYIWIELPQFHDSMGVDFINFFRKNRNMYEEVLKLLDEESKVVYERVINYRLTAFLPKVRGTEFWPQDIGIFRKKIQENLVLEKQLKEQGLHDFLIHSILNYSYDLSKFDLNKEIKTILDLGGFVGNSSIVMNFLYPESNIYMFEPDVSLFHEIQINIGNLKNVHHIKKGIWHEPTNLNFNISDVREASSIGNGDTIVEVTSIDDFLGTNKVDFIKFDIEGAELEALNGGKESIVRNRPILAISIYHKPSHLYEIPVWIKENLENYTIKIEHPSGPFVWGTLCYAIPSEILN